MSARKLLLASVMTVAVAAPVLAQTTTPGSGTNGTTPGMTTPTTPGTSTTPGMGTTPSTTGSVTGAINDMFYRDASNTSQWRASEAMGLSVYNRAGERIGEVDDIIFDNTGRIAAAVVGVGGFLGLGERKVAVNYRAFEMTRESNGNPRLVADLNKQSLTDAPAYQPARRN